MATVGERAVRIWNLATGELQEEVPHATADVIQIPITTGPNIARMSFLPDGALRIGSRLLLTKSTHLQRQADQLGALHAAISADGHRIWLGDPQGKIHLFNQKSGAKILDFTLGEPLSDVAIDPLTTELLAATRATATEAA